MTAFTENEGTRIVLALESIAKSLDKIANPPKDAVFAYDSDGTAHPAYKTYFDVLRHSSNPERMKP